MRITVKLFANFRVNRFKEGMRDYPANTLVKDIIRDLDIPESEVGIIFINGRNGTRDSILAEGDTLSLFPLVGGG